MSAILCLDCGNTRIKWGLRSTDRWSATGSLPTSAAAQIGAQLPSPQTYQSVVGCNVAGPIVAAAMEAALKQPVAWQPARSEQCGVRNGYSVPTQLGADRWAALIGARVLHDGAALVVNSGTATTIDVIDESGLFRGGLILPGLALMRESLPRGTAQLPQAQGLYRRYPSNTDDAIESGILHGTVGAIERMFSIADTSPSLRCLLAGGAAETLAPLLSIPFVRIDNLVLEGLARMAMDGTPHRNER